MVRTFHWALLRLATSTFITRFAYTAGVVDATSMAITIFGAILQTAVRIRVSRIALAFSLVAKTMIATFIWARFNFTCNTGPLPVAKAGTVVAHSTSSTVAWACFRGTISAHPTFVTLASQINGTNTITRTFLRAYSSRAIFAFMVIITFADTVITTSIVRAFVQARFSSTCSSSETWGTITFSILARSVTTTLVWATFQWRNTLSWACFF